MKKSYQNDIIVNPASQISYFSLRHIWLVWGLSNARTTIFQMGCVTFMSMSTQHNPFIKHVKWVGLS